MSDANQWRKRAEQRRVIAEQMTSPTSRAEMLRIAERYERLARRAEAIERGEKPG